MLFSKADEIRSCANPLEAIPELGSKNLPASIQRSSGGNVRKLAVDPFDAVCECGQIVKTVCALGIVRQRAAR